MKKIYKYPLFVTDDQTITLQGKPLSAINLNDGIVLYALFDETEKPKNYAFHISGTGHLLADNIVNEYTFLNTVVMRGGRLVFHIFYREI